MLFCGIDGGGTHTRCVLIDGMGRIAGSGESGTSNVSDIGVVRSMLAIGEALAAAIIDSGRDEKPAALCAGIAGALAQRDELKAELSGMLPGALIDVGSDADNTLYAAIGSGDGTVLICGTGCSVLSMKNGERKQTGGWGYLIGDGGGYEIGRMALARALAAYDGRQEPCPILTEKLTEALGKPPQEAIPDIYAGGKPFVASLVSAAAGAADEGDEAAKKIFADDMGYVARCVSVGAAFTGSREVSFTGGVLANDCALSALKAALPDIVLRPIETPPQLAAAMRAAEMYMSRTLGKTDEMQPEKAEPAAVQSSGETDPVTEQPSEETATAADQPPEAAEKPSADIAPAAADAVGLPWDGEDIDFSAHPLPTA